MSDIKALTGNEAIAYGVRLAKPKVIAAYPITPQTTIVETLANFVADGSLKPNLWSPKENMVRYLR